MRAQSASKRHVRVGGDFFRVVEMCCPLSYMLVGASLPLELELEVRVGRADKLESKSLSKEWDGDASGEV